MYNFVTTKSKKMQNKTKLETLKNGLPHGGLNELAERTGLTRTTIYNIFDGKKAMLKNVKKVVEETEKIISEYQELTGQTPNA